MDWPPLSSCQFPLHAIAIRRRHGNPLALLGCRSQIDGISCIVRIDCGLHGEVANLCLCPRFIVQTDILKIPDIREDGVIVGLVGRVEGGRFRRFRAGQVGRRAWHWRIVAGMVGEGHRIFVGDRWEGSEGSS